MRVAIVGVVFGLGLAAVDAGAQTQGQSPFVLRALVPVAPFPEVQAPPAVPPAPAPAVPFKPFGTVPPGTLGPVTLAEALERAGLPAQRWCGITVIPADPSLDHKFRKAPDLDTKYTLRLQPQPTCR